MTTPMIRIVAPLLTMVAALLASSMLMSAASAATADYSVRITTTGDATWRTYGRGPFQPITARVQTLAGSFATGDYTSWRAVTPGSGSEIVGGSITIRQVTPDEPVRGRILVGTGNSPIVLHDGMGDATVTRAIDSGKHDWFQFDLRSTSSMKTTRAGTNHISLVSADLILRDTVPPVLAAVAIPPATTWHGASACPVFRVHASDQGGGLRSVQVRRASDGHLITSWSGPISASLQPGLTGQEVSDCAQPAELGHGDTGFVATVHDVSGLASELRFSIRADHRPPSVSGGPTDGARFTTDSPELAFTVGDQGAGIASVSATLDGHPAAVTSAGGSMRVAASKLAIGAHHVVMTAVDGAGNRTSVGRSFSVTDTTAPTLTLRSPGPSGEATVWLSVAAGDDMSGVDVRSWRASVNGESVQVTVDGAHMTAQLGPLAPGRQRIEVRVSDAEGNEARLEHVYEVVAAHAPSMPNVGSSSGIYVVDAPSKIVQFGRPSQVTAYVVRNGRPMAGQLVQVQRGERVLSSATTDEHGVAAVSFRVGRPGSYRVVVSGLAVDPAPLSLRIAPRIVLMTNTRRPRVGQRVRVTGRIVPAIRGRKLSVQARIGGAWYPIRRTATTNGAGSFTTWVTSATRGTVGVRVRVLTVGAWAGATSNQRVLRVRAAKRR